MTSTFTTSKGLEEPASGDYVNAWAPVVNGNWTAIDAALGGTTSISVTGISAPTTTLALAQYRPPNIEFTGTLGANLNYQIPTSVGGMWSINNAATGAFTLSFGIAAGNALTLAAGRTLIISDGTTVALASTGTQLTGPIIAGLLNPVTTVPILASYMATALEIAAGLTITNYTWAPYEPLRYGADPTGVADSTAAFNQATCANYSPIVAPSAYKTVFVRAGQYKLTDTVYVPAGTILHGGGMSTYIDASAAPPAFANGNDNVFRLGWSLVSSVPTKDTIYLTGGYPPEIYGLFVNGGPASASVVSINYPGALCHDIWFAAPGQAIFLAGGYAYDCEIDGGLTGITVGGGGQNQTISNVRFFNQNTSINFDTSTTDIDTCIIIGCTIEYPNVTGISFGSGAVNVKGIQIIGNVFNNNPAPGVTSFSNCINVTNSNTKAVITGNQFNNWGRFNGPLPTAAIAVAGANADIDIVGNLFDGSPTNAAYTASTTALGVSVTAGTVRMSANRFRNLPFGGGALFMSGASQCSVKINGLIYDNVAANTVVNISNSNATSIFSAQNVQGDGVTPFLNAQASVSTTLKNMDRWFGGIGTSGGSSFVTFPYQPSGIYQVTLTANQNAPGSGAYRKSRADLVQKMNDFINPSALSLLNFSTLIQGPSNSGTSGNATLILNIEFGAVGGGTSIPTSSSGLLAVSWPTTYTSVSIDIQVLQSG